MRRGLSLLEVVLALAILGVSLSVLGELIRLGTRSGESARDNMESQLICESMVNEIAAGVQLPETIFEAPVDELGEWVYSVESQAVDQAGLVAVRVSVRRSDSTSTVLSFSLTRWMIDPAVEQAARDADALMQQQIEDRKNALESGTTTDAGEAASDPAAAPAEAPPADEGNSRSGRPKLPDGLKLPDGFELPEGFELPPDGKLPRGLKLPDGFDPSQIQRLLQGGGRGGPGGGKGSGGRGGRGGGGDAGGGRGGP